MPPTHRPHGDLEEPGGLGIQITMLADLGAIGELAHQQALLRGWSTPPAVRGPQGAELRDRALRQRRQIQRWWRFHLAAPRLVTRGAAGLVAVLGRFEVATFKPKRPLSILRKRAALCLTEISRVIAA